MKTVLSHSGKFHTDDVVACMLIELMEGEIEITRSRELQDKEQYDWIVDVGRVYDPFKNWFDHHQEGCNETWSDKYPILLSSSGMVFKHYWKEILTNFGFENPTEQEATRVYEKIFLPIDAHDNGQQTKEYYLTFTKTNFPDGVQMGQVVANMNADNVESALQNERFRYAMHYTFESITPMISSIIKDCRNNERIVNILKDIDHNGILVLPKGTWTNHYILSQIDPKRKIYFTIYNKGANYGFSAVQNGRFKNRADLIPYDAKYEGLIFIHKNLFVGEATSLETAKLVCEESIKAYKLQRNLKIGAGVVVASGIAYLVKQFY